MKQYRIDWVALLQPQNLGAIATGILLVLTLLLGWQYYEYVSATDNLVALQQEYREYISVLKQIATDTARYTSAEKEESLTQDEKKKDFLVVNRTALYLQQSLINYLQEKGPEVNMNDIEELYRSYTSQQLDKIKKKPSRASTALAAARCRRARIPRQKKIISSPEPRETVDREAVSDFSVSWPVERGKFWLSSFFGQRKNRITKRWEFHKGLDLAACKGTLVTAAQSGQVVFAGYATGYGNTVVIQHNTKYKTRYAHLHKISVRQGDYLSQGSKVGTVGDTGLVRSKGHDASHLHFEVYMYGRQINPLLVLS